MFERCHTWYIAALSGGARLYTSAVVPRLVHLCTDSLSMHIGTVLSAQYYVRVLPLLLAYVYGIPVDDMLERIG